MEGGEHGEACAGGVLECGLDNVVHSVALHFLSAHGREGVAYAGKEQTEIFVDFGARAYGGTRIATRDFLLYGDGGRQAFYVVTLGLVHSSEKLSRIG